MPVGKKTPKIASSPRDCVIPPKKDRATAIVNIHKKIGENRACGSGDRLADKQTHTDVPITILRRRPCRRSNKNNVFRNLKNVTLKHFK